MKRSKSLLVVCSVGLAGVLAYLASGQQPNPPSPTPINLSVVSREGGTGGRWLVNGWILWSDGSVTKVDLTTKIRQ